MAPETVAVVKFTLFPVQTGLLLLATGVDKAELLTTMVAVPGELTQVPELTTTL